MFAVGVGDALPQVLKAIALAVMIEGVVITAVFLFPFLTVLNKLIAVLM